MSGGHPFYICPPTRRIGRRGHAGASGALRMMSVSGPQTLISAAFARFRDGPELPESLHDWTATVTTCGRICYKRRKINLSQVFAGQNVSVRQVSDQIWLVTFMQYDLGYFGDETCRLEPSRTPFGPKVSPMSPE